MKIKILDCTFRDGGYYNNWDFSPDLIKDYLESIPNTGVYIVELGLRSFPRKGFYGPFAYTSESFLNELDISEKIKVSVMVDAKTILMSTYDTRTAVDKLFVAASQSKVDMVRIAAHFSEIEECSSIARHLKNLGYQVGLNLMQAGVQKQQDVELKVKTIDSWGLVDVLYFADSLGNMDEEEVISMSNTIINNWRGEVGFHAHNNMGNANNNCLVAIESGVTWVDVTITGMGRGAGNAQTELVLNDLIRKELGDFDVKPLYELVLEKFEPMQRVKGWGVNFAYYYSAINDIHPTYTQELLTDNRYSSSDVVTALEFLSKSESSSYDVNLVQQALDEKTNFNVCGKWDASEWCKDEDILILGSGPSLEKYSCAIIKFIENHNIRVLSLNIHKSIENQLIDMYVVVDTKRLILDIERYRDIKKTMFVPLRHIPDNVMEKLEDVDLRDFDMKVVADTFINHATGCEIPFRLAVAYAISLCSVGNANRVFLAGFDGYSADDLRQSEMVKTFELSKSFINPDSVISLTPTTYPVTQGSVYAEYNK